MKSMKKKHEDKSVDTRARDRANDQVMNAQHFTENEYLDANHCFYNHRLFAP